MFPGEPFWVDQIPQDSYETGFSYDIRLAAARQQTFYYQVSVVLLIGNKNLLIFVY